MSRIGLTQEDQDAAIVKAIQADMEIIRTDVNSLLLDLDTLDALAALRSRLAYVWGTESIWQAFWWFSKSNHVHVQIVLKDSKPLMPKLALAGFLGTDPLRNWLVYAYRKLAYTGVLFRPRKAPVRELEPATWEHEFKLMVQGFKS